MPETNGEPLNIHTAVRTIEKLEGLEIGLYQRTEGVTWMLWGLITAGIFLTFSTIASDPTVELSFIQTMVWVPWVAMGILASAILWHTAHLRAPQPVPDAHKHGIQTMVVTTLLFLAMVFLAITLYYFAQGRTELKEPGFVLAALGVAGLLIPFVKRPTCSPAGIRMLRVVGLLCIVTVGILAFAVPYSSVAQAYMVQTTAGVLIAGGGWFLGGLTLIAKG